LKNKYLQKINSVILIVSIVLINEINYLFYKINQSPDFGDYEIYFKYLFGQVNNTLRDQGLFYFYLQAKYFEFYAKTFNSTELALSRSILNLNSIFFVFGLFGVYKLLIFYNFSKKIAVYSLIFLNYLPISIAIRLSFKPEILAFALLPWIILFFEQYLKTKEKIYLFSSIPFIVALSSLKSSILALNSFFLFFFYFVKLYKANKKYFFIALFIVLTLLSLITLDNLKSNGVDYFNLQTASKATGEYDNTAPLSFFYKFNLYQLVAEPIKHNHAKSLFSIVLLDTMGDYFDIFWNNNNVLFSKNTKELVLVEQSNEIKSPKINKDTGTIVIFLQNKTEIYFSRIVSLFLSFLFYYYLLKKIFKNSEFTKFYISVIFSICIIFIHVFTGLPTKNFQLETGDTVKAAYFSYFILISGAFLFAEYVRKKEKLIYLLVPFVLAVFVIIGFPKNLDEEAIEVLNQKNEYTYLCNFNSLFISSDVTSCNQGQSEINEINYRETISSTPNFLLTFYMFLSVMSLTFKGTILLFLEKLKE